MGDVGKNKMKKVVKSKKQHINNSEFERHNYEPDKNNINRLCRLKHCEYADITADDVGRIIEIVEDGYGIEFFKKFKNAVDNKSTEEIRVVYGYAKDVILI